MSFIVLKGCVLGGERRKEGEIIELSNEREINYLLNRNQIARYDVKVEHVEPAVENRDPKPAKRTRRPRSKSNAS